MAFPSQNLSGGPRGPGRIDPADRTQIQAHPVEAWRIWRLFSPHKWILLVVTVLITLSSLVSMAQPFLVRGVIDTALPRADLRLLAWLAAGMVAVAAVSSVIGVVQTWLATRMGQQVMHDLRTSLFNHLQRQSVGFFTRTRGGDVQARLTHDISGMQSVVTSTATSVAANLTTAVATIVAMLALSPRLTLISLFVLPPSIYLSRRVALLRRDITAARQRELANLHTQVEEGLSVSGIRLTKTLGTSAWNTDRFAASSGRLVSLEIRSQLAGQWRMATMGIVFAAIPAAIYLAAGFPVASGGVTIGTLVAFTALQGTIYRPIMGLLNIGVQWVTTMALFSRIFEFLDLIPEVEEPVSPREVHPESVVGEIRFTDVGFSYEAGSPALSNINLVIPAGSTAALVGSTGSGKSTLGALLARLYDPSEGTVTIDGMNLREFAGADLASIVGVVSQEVYLVHASIRQNLLLAKPAASDSELWEALTAARIADLVTSLPEGLDTVVGARGHRFSGGEQQRLAIARTILRNPKILVLDEATSALDNKTEAEVQAALDELSKGRTTLVIAHRLSTIEEADQVFVLDQGRIVERGPASSLRSEGGAFARLAQAQLTAVPAADLTAAA